MFSLYAELGNNGKNNLHRKTFKIKTMKTKIRDQIKEMEDQIWSIGIDSNSSHPTHPNEVFAATNLSRSKFHKLLKETLNSGHYDISSLSIYVTNLETEDCAISSNLTSNIENNLE